MPQAPSTKGIRDLSSATRAHFKSLGRHALPWRKDQRPYYVWVSEMMLQQTQVERVVPKFVAFIKVFPDWRTLAKATLPQVYAQWRGLGYNRRAKYVREAAMLVVLQGELPDDAAFIRSLPGVGPYTAGAVRAFAFGNPEPFVETNIRTAVLHHCFPGKDTVRDEAILAVLQQLRPRHGDSARTWYAALMDYGAHLKRSGVRLNARTHGYAKQSTFKGSLRQLRGAILRALAAQPATAAALKKQTKREAGDLQKAVAGLMRDGLIAKRGATYRLVD